MKIEAFICGEMSANEAAAFESQMEENAALRERFQLYKNVQELMQTSQHGASLKESLRETIASVRAQLSNAQQNNHALPKNQPTP